MVSSNVQWKLKEVGCQPDAKSSLHKLVRRRIIDAVGLDAWMKMWNRLVSARGNHDISINRGLR